MTTNDTGKSQSVGSERRVSQRYLMTDGGFHVGHVVFAGSGPHSLHDISYGGFSAFPTPASPAPSGCETVEHAHFDPGTTMTVELHLLGAVKTGHATLVFAGPKGVGFAFNHETTVLLTFLRRILEPMRLGTQLRRMPVESRSERFRGDDWHVFQGEGPVDVLLRFEKGPVEKATVVEALVTFRQKQNYLSVAFSDGKFQTSVSQDTQGLGTRMASTGHVDAETLRKAAAILIGLLQVPETITAGPVAGFVNSMQTLLEQIPAKVTSP